MQENIELIARCVELGKISKTSPYPPDMKGQDGADEIAAESLRNGAHPDELLAGCMQGMERIGKQFAENKVYLPSLLMSAAAMNAVMIHLKPYLESGALKRKGVFVIGTVSGDLHDLGKNLVGMAIKGGGFEVIDLGVNVPPEKFVAAIAEHPGCFVGLSALLTTTMVNMEKSVQAIKQAHPGVKVLIGGAPVTENFCRQIGADFYSAVPQEAVDYLNKMVA
jgi:methanogenic corrinoid protein MtbC1